MLTIFKSAVLKKSPTHQKSFFGKIFRFVGNHLLRNYWYTDKEITFIMQTYQDYDLAVCNLSRLRKFYPASRLVVFSDGDPDPRYKNFPTLFRAEYFEMKRLYNLKNGGALLHRWLELFMLHPTKYLIRIDTDTRIDRRFRYLPSPLGKDVFGVTQDYKCLQGGCIVFSLKAAKDLFTSKVFHSAELQNPSSWGKNMRPDIYNERIKKDLVATDWLLQWAFIRENINVYTFKEIYSDWKITISNNDLKFAVVHPDKNICRLDGTSN